MKSDLVQYTPKVDALLDHAKNFTERDFADLALAAFDQMGIDPAAAGHMRACIEAWVAIVEARKLRDRTPEDDAAVVQTLRDVGAL